LVPFATAVLEARTPVMAFRMFGIIALPDMDEPIILRKAAVLGDMSVVLL